METILKLKTAIFMNLYSLNAKYMKEKEERLEIDLPDMDV